jgi:hypothetical protein
MKMREALRDHFTMSIIPRAGADAVTRIDCGLTGALLRAEIGMPGLVASPHTACQKLAMGVRAFEPTEIFHHHRCRRW